MPGQDPQPWTPLARSCPEFLSPGHNLEPTGQVASLAQTFRACRGVRWTRPSHTEACLACRQAMQLLAELLWLLYDLPSTEGQRGQAASLSDPRARYETTSLLGLLLGSPDMQRTCGTTYEASHTAPDHRNRARSTGKDHQVQPHLTSQRSN